MRSSQLSLLWQTESQKTSANSLDKAVMAPEIRKSAPLFSVVIATYRRDQKIEATLLSVARQSCQQFEVIVVSDGPAHPHLVETIKSFGSQFALYELPERSRSQSGPNNLGWEKARGKYIAYLGHDDIWAPHHLEELKKVFSEQPDTSFAISGTLMIGPPGAVDDYTWVSGIFPSDESEPGIRHFFPPSSVAHLRLPATELTPWPEPMKISAPVDSHFLLSAAQAGHLFYSTEKTTVLKFNSALRYLSYLQPEDFEQRKALELCSNTGALRRFISERVSLARKQGTFMFLRHPNPEDYDRGEIVKGHEKIRGIAITEVTNLREPVTIPPGEEPRGFDWHAAEQEGSQTWRWSGPSCRPRLPIAYTSDSPASLTVHIARCASERIRDSLQLFLNGSEIAYTITDLEPAGLELHSTIQLRSSEASVLEIRMCETVSPHVLNSASADTRMLGLCLTQLSLSPIE